MILIGEARQVVVRLRLEIGARDAALSLRVEQRQPALIEERVDKGGNEDGLAGAGETGDAQAQGRRRKARRKVLETARRHAGAVSERSPFQLANAP